MKTDLIGSLAALEELAPAWWDFYLRCPRATPFQSPQWLVPWTKHLFGGGDIWALAFQDGGDLVGFVPLFRWGTDQRSVSFLGAGVSDYGDLLYAPGYGSECANAVWEFLERQRERWDVIDLQELPGDSPLLQGCSFEQSAVCPVLDLSAWPDSMDRKYRAGIRRAREKLTRTADLRVTMANETDLAQHMGSFFRLHQARWGDVEDRLHRFHAEVARECVATGLLKLFLLWHGNTPVAANYSFASGSTLYFYLSGADPRLARFSPGALLLESVVEWAAAAGKKELDFLRHPDPYKYRWGARDRSNYKLTLTLLPNWR